MPRKIVTKESSASYPTMQDTFNNFCRAIAESIGSNAITSTDATLISLDSIGYSGISVKIDAPTETSGAWETSIHIINEQTGKNIKIVNKNSGSNAGYTNKIYLGGSSKPNYSAWTAVCARDVNNDGVIISAVPGNNPSTPDAVYPQYTTRSLVIFIGRDANGGILYGGGFGHCGIVCNGSNHYEVNYQATTPRVGDVLHVTKMVNYLSDGCPEMKSLYVSVVRPYSGNSDDTPKTNCSYYTDGSLWFIGGMAELNTYLNPPYDPIVKY